MSNTQAIDDARTQGYLTSDGKDQGLRRAWLQEAAAQGMTH